MDPSNAIRLILLRKVIVNKKRLIFTRSMLVLSNLSLFDVSFLLLLYEVGFFINLTGFLGEVEQMTTENDKRITRILFCGPHFPASQNYTKEYLQNYSFIQVDAVPFDKVLDVIADYHICVVKDMRLDSNVISHAKNMKLLMQFGVGVEGIDTIAATRCGIKVARIPGGATGNATSCAEMAIYLMLGLLRKQNEMQISVQQKKLGEPVGETLLGKTVFIMGFGNIGFQLAKRLRPFEVKIIATKRSWSPSDTPDSCQSNGWHY